MFTVLVELNTPHPIFRFFDCLTKGDDVFTAEVRKITTYSNIFQATEAGYTKNFICKLLLLGVLASHQQKNLS